MSDKYVAYVGTYTQGSSKGIHIFDVDTVNGKLTERAEVPLSNASYCVISKCKKYLYSICDMGVASFKILPNGDLEQINISGIEGMRGRYLITDNNNKYLFVGSYHDGKVTVLKLREDGGIEGITDAVFHKGVGTVSERNIRPHINSMTLTPDEKYLAVVDMGLGHVKLYSFDFETGKIKLVDVLRCGLESRPRFLIFSPDGKFAYLNCEAKKSVYVYKYNGEGRLPDFEFVQQSLTIPEGGNFNHSSKGMRMSEDAKYIFCTNGGSNSITIFERNINDGMLEVICSLPISGEYPKDVGIFPDNKFMVSVNHESDELIVFEINYEKKYFSWKGKPNKVNAPSSIKILKLD